MDGNIEGKFDAVAYLDTGVGVPTEEAIIFDADVDMEDVAVFTGRDITDILGSVL